jgi:NAD(P)-dependent dehydrogenase (short-subunit alcohol dehydrogenase family)
MQKNSSGIENKVVVITGASSGIGEATALLLAERGAKVVLGMRPVSKRLASHHFYEGTPQKVPVISRASSPASCTRITAYPDKTG